MIGAMTRVGEENSARDSGDGVRWSSGAVLNHVFLGLIEWSVTATGAPKRRRSLLENRGTLDATP